MTARPISSAWKSVLRGCAISCGHCVRWQIPGDAVYEDGQVQIDLAMRRVTAQGESARLTANEYEVLRRLIVQRDQGVTQEHLLR